MESKAIPNTDERLDIAGVKLVRGQRHKTALRVLELVDGSVPDDSGVDR